MHKTQEKLLKLIETKALKGLTLRKIGKLIEEPLPQAIKHHLTQLEKKGFISINKKKKEIVRTGTVSQQNDLLVSIPILGSANCGPALNFANDSIESYLKISKRLILSHKPSNYIIKADGHSLNKAKINNEKNIEDGDYILIDGEYRTPRDGDYIVAIIDDRATVKKFVRDENNNRIALISESTKDFAPIFIHENDNFLVCGKVLDVIKKI